MSIKRKVCYFNLYSKRVMKFSTVFKKFLRFLPIFAPVYEMACGNPSHSQGVIGKLEHCSTTLEKTLKIGDSTEERYINFFEIFA